ncbi:Sir2 family NAD-dependent protein deacetylase [Nocardioides sp.]|uniref:Sir2 family NAD-dependent protein deacetylase n=1 Tax=Nocardioides sp. TaxID=35761 RepID=UPI00271B2D7E|nr:Sir2 family NAD-dependent protein deacetylase [Nocardioides sp.]MDO9455354.1 Sir2 family NAD-dependent protein deacetylase [Nocardioides sp.]
MTPALDLLAGRPLVVLTGAGLSTDSGIPDYRGPGSPDRTPMTYQEFVSGPAAQQRYWARSHLGWGRMRGAEPNAGHRACAPLDPDLLITQNVDGLHEASGSRRLIALHGRIADVVCLSCRTTSARVALHARLDALNPSFAARHTDVETRPDGDVELDDTSGFVVPGCELCGGVLKPDVVFFGENVPKPRVERCYAAVDALAESGGALLVAGSSLTVMSGFRFVRHAAKAGTPVVIVNRGQTRGDDLATVKVDAGCSEFLEALVGVRSQMTRVSPAGR